MKSILFDKEQQRRSAVVVVLFLGYQVIELPQKRALCNKDLRQFFGLI
jgi:hypothetical protein